MKLCAFRRMRSAIIVEREGSLDVVDLACQSMIHECRRACKAVRLPSYASR